jgi:hypothetical protein
VTEPKDRTSVPSLDDLDAGWGDEEDEKDEKDEKADKEDEAEAREIAELEAPEPPGLTAEQHEARLAALAAKKERARAKAAAKKERRKERRKARAEAAAAKKKVKQKRKAPEPERSAPSLRGVSRDTDAEEAPEAADEQPAERKASPNAVRGRPARRSKQGPNWQTLAVIAVLVAMLGGVAAFLLRK